MADWSLPREDLSRRARERGAPEGDARENFRPPLHERAQSRAARFRQFLRRVADLQFGSVWDDLAVLLPNVQGTLADVGCGAQPFRELLKPDVRYIGIDIDEAQSRFGYGDASRGGADDRARSRGASGAGSSDMRRFSGSVLPLADGEADAVLCTETLEHVRDTAPFLRELERGLRPGGELILTVPFAARWHFVPYDYWRFTPSALAHLLTQAGFCEVRVYARGGALAVASYKVVGYVLTLLVGHRRRGPRSAASRLLGVCLLPLAAFAALTGHIGVRFPGTAEDCLGYTVLARRPPETP